MNRFANAHHKRTKSHAHNTQIHGTYYSYIDKGNTLFMKQAKAQTIGEGESGENMPNTPKSLIKQAINHNYKLKVESQMNFVNQFIKSFAKYPMIHWSTNGYWRERKKELLKKIMMI